jgi:hypothetical protein
VAPGGKAPPVRRREQAAGELRDAGFPSRCGAQPRTGCLAHAL